MATSFGWRFMPFIEMYKPGREKKQLEYKVRILLWTC